MSKYTVANVQKSNEQEMLDFLKEHEDTTLFLQSNYYAYGYLRGEETFSGDYYLIRCNGSVVGVFALTNKGTLLIECEEIPNCINLVLETCQQDSVPLIGVIGEWNCAYEVWQSLLNKKVISKETFRSKEVLYSLNIQQTAQYENPKGRPLQSGDFQQWLPMRKAYMDELDFPRNWSDEELKRDFSEKVEKQEIWGIENDGKLVAIGDLNATAGNIAQVGGVYTDPNHRNQHLSRSLMKQLIIDSSGIHGYSKLIIFTGTDNPAAQRVYESLGAKKVGYYALLFGE